MFEKRIVLSIFSITMSLVFLFFPVSVNAEERNVPVTAVIEAPKGLHNVKVTIEGQGNVFLSKDKAYKDEEISIVATPIKGWKFKEWKVNGGVVISDLGFDVAKNGAFTMPDEDVEITVVFERIPQPTSKEPDPVPPDPEPEEPVPTPPSDDPKPTPPSDPEDDIFIPTPREEPRDDTLFDKIENLVPLIATVAGSSIAVGGFAFLLLLFRRKRTFKGVFSEERIPGTKIKGDSDMDDWGEWFIPDMIKKIANGQMTIAEYINTLNDATVSTVFPSDTTMEVFYGEMSQEFKAEQKEMFKILSKATGEITFRFVSGRTGMDFSITYDIQ